MDRRWECHPDCGEVGQNAHVWSKILTKERHLKILKLPITTLYSVELKTWEGNVGNFNGTYQLFWQFWIHFEFLPDQFADVKQLCIITWWRQIKYEWSITNHCRMKTLHLGNVQWLFTGGHHSQIHKYLQLFLTGCWCEIKWSNNCYSAF